MRRRRIVTAASRKQEAAAAAMRQETFDNLEKAFWNLPPSRDTVVGFIDELDDEEYLRLLRDVRNTIGSNVPESEDRHELLTVFISQPDRHTAALEALPQNVRDYWGWRTIESRLEGLRGLTREELIQLAKDLDIEKYHGKLMWPRYDAYMLRQALMFFHDEFTDRLSPFAAGRKLNKKGEHIVGKDDFEPCEFDEEDEEIELDEDDIDDEREDGEVAIRHYTASELDQLTVQRLRDIASIHGLGPVESSAHSRSWLRDFIIRQQEASGL